MPETLFSFNEWNAEEAQNKFRGRQQKEYYAGDFWIDCVGQVSVVSSRVTSGPVSIINQRSRTNMCFRRTRHHIREDGTDLSVIWFVRRGTLTYSDQHGSKTANPGDFAITRSTFPFSIECRVDSDSIHEVFHVTVPTYILREYLPFELSESMFFDKIYLDFFMAQKLFEQVFHLSDGLLNESTRLLVETAFTIIGNGIRSSAVVPREKLTASEHKLRELLRFIVVHISNPQLSTQMVAKSCGISPRYLSTLFQQFGMTFSEFLWSQRLEKAREWLAASDSSSISIAEIAYAVGFKSSAHFSRLFKKVFKVAPRNVRGTAGSDRMRAIEDAAPIERINLALSSDLLQ